MNIIYKKELNSDTDQIFLLAEFGIILLIEKNELLYKKIQKVSQNSVRTDQIKPLFIKQFAQLF